MSSLQCEESVIGCLGRFAEWTGQRFGLEPLAALIVATGPTTRLNAVAHGVFKQPTESQLVGHHDDSDDPASSGTDRDDDDDVVNARPISTRRKPITRDPVLGPKRTTLLRRLLEAAPNRVPEVYLAEHNARRGPGPILAAVLETQVREAVRGEEEGDADDSGVRSLTYNSATLSSAVASLACAAWGARTLRRLVLEYYNENISDVVFAKNALAHCAHLESLGLMHAGPLVELQFVLDPPPAIFRRPQHHPLFSTLRSLHLSAGPSNEEQLELITTRLVNLRHFSFWMGAGEGPDVHVWVRCLPDLLAKLETLTITSDDSSGVFEALRSLEYGLSPSDASAPPPSAFDSVAASSAFAYRMQPQPSRLRCFRCTSMADDLQDISPFIRYLRAVTASGPSLQPVAVPAPPLSATVPLLAGASLAEVILEYQLDLTVLIPSLIEHLPASCTALGLLKFSSLSDAHVGSLLVGLPHLRSLHIGHCPWVTFRPANLTAGLIEGSSLVSVVRAPNLRRLTVPDRQCQRRVEDFLAAPAKNGNTAETAPAVIFPRLRRVYVH